MKNYFSQDNLVKKIVMGFVIGNLVWVVVQQLLSVFFTSIVNPIGSFLADQLGLATQNDNMIWKLDSTYSVDFQSFLRSLFLTILLALLVVFMIFLLKAFMKLMNKIICKLHEMKQEVKEEMQEAKESLDETTQEKAEEVKEQVTEVIQKSKDKKDEK